MTVTAEGVSYHPIGSPTGILGTKDLDEKSAIMTLMNEAIDSCGRGAFRLPFGYTTGDGQ